ncbi:MAG: SDR family NAD(P)-dependent oxidoreductase [Clostridiales bacterium]|nr:SDR family NAD(P)-dependent oxidoreductase [Clostridiales bacterium]
MKKHIYGKCVIITGASGGLGFGIAKKLIEDFDCNVIGIARNEDKLIKNALTLPEDKRNKFTYHLFDVSKKEKWIEFRDSLVVKNVIPDMLINNAGFMLPFTKIENLTDEEVEEIIDVNLKSVIYSTRIMLPLLKQSPTPSIVNISSAAGLCAVVGESMYCATKFAVKGFTESIRQEYPSFYIAGVYPGFIRTNILHRMDDSAKNNKLINKFMMPLDKAVKKIVRRIKAKRKRIVLGFDGHSMSFFSRIMPTLTPKIAAKVLKASKLSMFENVFDENKNNKGE